MKGQITTASRRKSSRSLRRREPAKSSIKLLVIQRWNRRGLNTSRRSTSRVPPVHVQQAQPAHGFTVVRSPPDSLPHASRVRLPIEDRRSAPGTCRPDRNDAGERQLSTVSVSVIPLSATSRHSPAL